MTDHTNQSGAPFTASLDTGLQGEFPTVKAAWAWARTHRRTCRVCIIRNCDGTVVQEFHRPEGGRIKRTVLGTMACLMLLLAGVAALASGHSEASGGASAIACFFFLFLSVPFLDALDDAPRTPSERHASR